MSLEKTRIGVSEIHVFFTMFLASIIPFNKVFITYSITLWIISAIVLMIVRKDSASSFKPDFGFVISMLIYLIFVVGVFYSQNKPSALFDIQVKLSMLVIPPVMYLLRDFYKRYFNYILVVFVIANIIAGLICMAFAFYHSFHYNNGSLIFNSNVPGIYPDLNTKPPNYFFYTNFSVFKHPAYFSMYLVLCVFIVFYFLRNSFSFFNSRVKNIITYYSVIIFLVIIIFFLESKAAYVSLLLLTLIFSIGYVVKEKKWIWGIAIISAIIVISVIGFKQNSRFYYISSALKNKDGFMTAIQNKDYKVLIDSYGIDRIPIWMIAGEIINENLWIGVGSGDVSDRLMEKYKFYKLQTLENNRYNTHNQYLETFIAVGLIGFLIFMAWLFYPLFCKKNFTKEHFLILIFSGILILNFMFEAALNTISGIIFVAFFYSFLLFVSVDRSVSK